MKNRVTVLQLLTGFVLSGIFFCTFTFAQETEPIAAANKSLQNETSKTVYAPNHVLEIGEILYSIQTNKDNVLGVTVVNNQVIISSAGASSELSNDNSFHVYNFDGTLINSYSQGSTTGWGFRDLAFDGTYILGSEDNTVKKIDPNTFQIAGSITNANNTIHRGLAYDAVDNTIWSTNGSTGPIVQMDAVTGNTLRNLPNPVNYAKPYGIAFDRFTGSQSPYLWFAEPWIYGSFRLSKMDVIDGLIYYTIDLKEALGNPANCLSGGLEIINNHPEYPGKIIAIAIEQNTNTILFVDITGTPLPETVLLQSGFSFGGWIHGAVLQNNFAFVFQANNLNVLDLLNDNEKLSSLTFSAQGNGGIIINDYFYFSYPNWETTSKKKIEIVNISNKNNISNAGSFETSRILNLGIEKLVNCFTTPGNNLLLILTKESTNIGVNEKILMYNLATPTGLIFSAELSADIKDIAANGNYLYVLLMNGSLTVYDISNNTFLQAGNVVIENPEKISALGNYVYTACNNLNGLKIIDVSDPQLPFEAAVFGNGLYSFYDDILITNPKAFLKTIDFDIVAVDVADPLLPVEIFNFNPEGVGNFKFSGNYSNSLFLTNIGTLFEIDYSNPALPSVTIATYEPSITRSNTNIGDKLYTVGDDKLWVYDIDDDGVPSFNTSIDIAKANKVFTDDNYLFICDRDNLLYIYNTSLQLLGTYNAGAPVTDLEAMNNLLYLVLYNSTTLKIVDYSNPVLPVERSSFELPYAGQAVSISSDGNTLYTASNKTTLLGNIQGYFQTIDISNPANPVLLSDNQITGGNTIYNVCVDNNTLFIGGSDDDGWFPLEAWDVTDPVNPVLMGRTMFSFPGPLSDIAYFNGYIFAALPTIGQILSYRWDSTAKEFFPGPSITSPEPREIRILKNFPTSSSSKALSRISGTPPSYNYAVVNNGAKYQQQTEGSKGNKIVKIVNIPKQPDPLFADLTMGIYPLEAGLHGCTTSPAPGGPYTFIKGTTVDLSAIDNPQEGWCFKEWIGAGGNKNTTIVMDNDKDVTANFVEVKLSVSGTAIEEAVCPQDAIKEYQKLLPIVLCASPASGWAVNGITFQGSGTGNEANDFLFCYVYKGAENIGSGVYFNDNGECFVGFSQTLIVPANECVTLNLYYPFKEFIGELVDAANTYLVETKTIHATPLEYPEGLIEGKARRNGPFAVARIYNDWEIGFSYIQEAVNSELTQDGGTCYLCDGVYEENVLINENSKEVTITSVNGKEKVFIKRKSKDADAIQVLGKYSIKVKNITFDGTKEGVGYAVTFYRSNSVLVSGNTFQNFKVGLVVGSDTKNLTVEDNLFDSNERGISLVEAENNTIRRNKFGNSTSDDSHISIFKGKSNFVYENGVLQPGNRLYIYLGLTELNKIYSNDGYTPTGAAKYPSIYLEESHSNEITNNLCFELYLKKSNSNKIQSNELLKIELRESESNDIIKNNISGQDRISANGIYLSTSSKNFISQNNIYHNDKNGIDLPLYSYDNFLNENTINHNKQSGVNISHSSGTNLYKNTIYDNEKDGVYVFSSGRTSLTANKITGHNKKYDVMSATEKGAGAHFFDCPAGADIFRNTFKNNCTAVLIDNSGGTKNFTMSGNEVSNSFCLFTGIHLDNSSAEIFGNNIIDNLGNGILFSNNSNGVVRANNIFGNTEYGVNNSDQSVTINISDNWWGNETGPSTADVTGNLTISNWLSAPVSLFCNTARDTIHISAGKTDSSSVHFQNFKFPDDVLDINVSDELGWITSPAAFISQMHDSSGTSVNIIFNAPAGVNEGVVNKVSVSAQSRTEANVSAKDSFYIFIYKPLLSDMSIYPDSSTIAVGDSIQFSVTGNDQHGNAVEITPTWQASIGEISADGIFKCSTAGTAEITAVDTVSGIQAKTSILVTEQEVQLTGIKIYPDSATVKTGETLFFEARGYNQFGFPHQVQVKWTCDRDLINNDGIFTADSIAGTYTVTAEDTLTGIKATATVFVESVVSVEEEKIIPTEFKLYQNYPNPFNPVTKIKFTIPAVETAHELSLQQQFVTLIVYNILGQEVATLIDEPKLPGIYEVYFNASNLASGIYFYIIYAKAEDGKKDFRAVKKMMLIK